MRGPLIISPTQEQRVLRSLAKAFREASVYVVHNPKVLDDDESLGKVVLDALRASGFNPKASSMT